MIVNLISSDKVLYLSIFCEAEVSTKAGQRIDGDVVDINFL
jgi:hypothetical protein